MPWTILRATQFFGFAGMLARRIARDGVATVPPLLVQPVDVTEVADLLAGTAVGMPQGWRTSNSDPTSPWQFFGRRRGHALTADRMSRSLGYGGDAVPVVWGELGQSGAQRREVAACS